MSKELTINFTISSDELTRCLFSDKPAHILKNGDETEGTDIQVVAISRVCFDTYNQAYNYYPKPEDGYYSTYKLIAKYYYSDATCAGNAHLGQYYELNATVSFKKNEMVGVGSGVLVPLRGRGYVDIF